MTSKPHFLITVDTKGDGAWTGGPRAVRATNVGHLERFQDLCESNGLRPTYLTNYELANCPVFRGFAGWILARRVGEIGAHLHPWSTPPLVPLTPDDRRFRPYLIEYPETVIREKLRTLTGRLEETFGVKMTSHRAGRWSLDERYASLLIDEGYRVDCSVTPLLTWEKVKGDPVQGGGTNYENFPHDAYWVDLDDISQPGTSRLLEVPLTILPGERTEARSLSEALEQLPRPLPALTRPLQRVCDRVTPPVRWLRPNGRNGLQLLEVVEQVLAEGRSYAQFTFRASDLAPGGGSASRTDTDIERLFNDLSVLFSAVRGRFQGTTLTEFHAETVAREVEPAVT